jgi:nucleoside-diphosphate-sugar epimerase
MKILITGNMGYIGPCLVHHLRKNFPGFFLVGLDTGYFGNCLTNEEILPECNLDAQIFGDVRNFPAESCEGVDAVVHLAAISNDPMGNKFEDVTFDINFKSTIEMAQKAKMAGAKAFVYASSCSMYGSAESSARNESSPLNPLTAYAKSKVSSEIQLKTMADDNFKITSLRFATACGMSERLRLDLVLNDFVACAVASKKITILSDGTPWRPLINIKDMARAIEWAIIRKNENGGNFLAVNVGSDQWNFQVKDLAEAVSRVIPNIEISINREAQPDKRSYKVNFNLFKKLAPSYQPRFDIMTTIEELKTGLEAMGFKDSNFRQSRFMRLKVLTELQENGYLNERLEWTSKVL